MKQRKIKKYSKSKANPRKSSGFSMIELLATVVILGILMAFAIVSVTRIIDQGKKNYDETQKDEVRLAAESYVQNNRKYLPKTIGQKTKVTLKQLVNANYIKNVKDSKNKACDLDQSYVTIFKYSKTQYSYSVHLVCSNNVNEDAYKKPEITIQFETAQLSNAKAKVTLKGDSTGNTKLLSYSYIISVGGKAVKTSENKMINYKKTYTFDIDLSGYTNEIVSVKVTATNINGESKTVESSSNLEATEGPTCGTITGESTDWTKEKRTISVECIDNQAGCERKKYTKTFTSDTKNGIITIKDKNGKTTNCPVSVYIDTTAPSVPTINMYKWKDNNTRPTSSSDLSTYTNDTWSGIKVYTEASGSIDELSGGIYYQFTTTGDTTNETNAKGTSRNIEVSGTSYIKYRACDKAGNCSNYSEAQTIKIDMVKPVLKYTLTKANGSTYTNGSLTDQDVVRVLKPEDSLSGIDHTEYNSGNGWQEEKNVSKYTYTANNNAKFRTIDKVGNISDEITLTIKIEKNPDRNYKISCSRTCWSSCNLNGYWNDGIWTWNLSGAGSGVNTSTMAINYSTQYVTNYCNYYPSNAPNGSRRGCGKAYFSSSSMQYSRSYAKSSIVGRACTKNGVCATCTVYN